MGPAATPENAQAERFAELQAKLKPQWRLIRRLNHEEHSVVIVPSVSVEVSFPAGVLQAYEERLLFLLLLLRQKRTRVIYVTSQPILPEILEYYLELLPGVDPGEARQRLFPVPVLDGSSRPLTRKLLERPRRVARVRDLIPNPDTCHLICFSTTELERDLALTLGIPMYGADPALLHFGTKSGGRRVFVEEGVPCALGYDVRTQDDLVDGIRRLRRERPGIGKVVVKLDESVSGEGNGTFDLDGLPVPGDASEADRIAGGLPAIRFELAGQTWDDYRAKLARVGGVVEEWLSGQEFRSPSVQLRVTPFGEVELLSTHDQLLGGPGGQSYLGCVFPADPAYATAISGAARKIGDRLAREGVIGRFAVDFVVVRSVAGEWREYAIEINLRKGGTTTPHLTLEFLTDGHYDAERGVFLAPDGQPRHYVASDHVEADVYRALAPEDLIAFARREGLHFSQDTGTGIVFHMLNAVTEFGRFGLTAVGRSREEAQSLYDRAAAGALDEARA